ncbi:LysM peptidoglycan-binding domain-containing protein [Peptostreptococcus equinus]|uniref:LysM peptidoglycan-binding domain-containing protein n=1 Tax=Peptostreptococcus equinus TaxID=3003601 RepID=A0ABY7JRY6_9FIRM|nr:LysM peptidoglycan-binding domain-containing protein [Peptostreptococcus sp. CBA3647]WAW14745.1 LysM peptidoglycan-binding domain-containing protein [Peptostreptococcus sp. CBA3647]
MEAWLKTSNKSFRFPIVPQEIEVSGDYKVDTEYLANGDEIAVYCGQSLKRTSLSSHFPSDKDRSYLDFYTFPSPLECVKIVDEIARSQEEIRYIVTETEINWPIKITNFKRGHKDPTGDIEFSLDILEYTPPKAVSWAPAPQKNDKPTSSNNNSNKVNLITRPTPPPQKVRYHIVKKGDYLWDISFKYYRKGSLFHKIKNNSENQKRYPSLKKSSMIYSGWKLVIP